MKKVLAVVMLLLSLHGFAADVINNNPNTVNCESILQAGDKAVIAQSGCCSHHQGVCGCSSGRAQCCDGVLSPSCGCNSIVPIDNFKVDEVKVKL